MVIYCGKETKISLNQGKYSFKTSVLEKKLNILLFINVIILLVLAGIMSGRLYQWLTTYGIHMKYLFPEKGPVNASGYAGNGYASYFILFNQLIPLSMLVTLEVAKMSYSRMMEHDVEMMSIDYELNQIQETRVQNFTLNEQLGSVSYILCDKTGTLTQNELVFRGISYPGTKDEPAFLGDVKDLGAFNS